MAQLLEEVKTYVQSYMDQFDASHDYQHILRVCSLAHSVATREVQLDSTLHYHSHIITLASLLHDVGDGKYLRKGQDGKTMVENLLINFGASVPLAKEVQEIVNHVSYSNEIKDPASVQECLLLHPELAVVQDADRLDAIGAVGIGRCFGYTVARGQGDLHEAVEHFQQKLEKLEGMMKTRTGKDLARCRTRRLV